MPGESHTSDHHTTGAEALRYTASRAPHQCRPLSGFAELRGTCRSASGKPSRRVGDDLTGQQKHHQHWLVTEPVRGRQHGQSIRLPSGPATPVGRRAPRTRVCIPLGWTANSWVAAPAWRENTSRLRQGNWATLWSKVTEPSCNHGGSEGLPANADPKAQAAHIAGEAARASGSPLHVPSLLLPRHNSLVGALCRWHRHAVPRDLWAVPVAFARPSRRVLGRRTGRAQGQP